MFINVFTVDLDPILCITMSIRVYKFIIRMRERKKVAIPEFQELNL